MARLTFDQLTTVAALPKGASNRDTAVFHYFNPNGVYAAKKASDARITAACEAGECKWGAVIAHGSMNDYHTRALAECATARRAGSFQVSYAVRMIRDDIAKADRFLANIPDFARPDGFVAA